MKKIIIAFVCVFGIQVISSAQDSEIGTEGGGASCASTDKNNAYCNKYSSPGSLPSYYCETTSCSGSSCFDCLK